MFRAKSLINTRGGSVLPLVIVVVVLMATIGAGVLGLGFHSRMLAIRSGEEITSRCAADAAVAAAVFQMNEKLKVKPWDNSWLPSATNVALQNCDASFDYVISKNDGVYTVHGTGRAGHSVHSVEGQLRVYSVFDLALFARDYLELKNGANIDWINNEPGDWPLQVGTNSTNSGAISLKNATTINGDVVVGFGGDPDVVIDAGSGVTVTGGTYAMFSNAVLPSVSVPSGLASMPSGGSINTGTEWSTSGKYDSINLGSGDVLTITEPVVLYITGDVILKNSARIDIGGSGDTDNDASLIIYLVGNLECKNSSTVNNLTADATRFTFYGLDSCAKIEMKNDSSFYGAIYARNAFIDLHNSIAMYGSIVGESILLRNSANFYYDVALRDRTIDDDAIRFVIQRWSEQ